MLGMPLSVTGNLLPFIILCECCSQVFPFYSLLKNSYQMLHTSCVYEVWHLRETLQSTILRTHPALVYTCAHLIAATVPALQCG